MPALKFKRSEGFFSPSVFLLDLSFFFWSEVVLDVEIFADLNNGLILDLRCDLGAGELEEWLNIEVVGCHDKLEELFLLEVNVIGVPLVHDLCHIAVGEGLIDFGWLMVEESLAENNDLLQDLLLHLWEWDLFFNTGVLNETLDQD